MKNSFYLILLFVAFVCLSCSKMEKTEVGRQAAIAAKEYYDLLLQEKYDSFVMGYNQPCQLPQRYHEQLLLNARMFVEQQKKEHKGIVDVDILSVKADTSRHVSEVFLQMVYGDSTKEQILVPMVNVNGMWKMR